MNTAGTRPDDNPASRSNGSEPPFSENRGLPAKAAFCWLAKGFDDLKTQPALSLFYGGGVFAASIAIMWTMFQFGMGNILFPALAGFMILGPVIAVGLYEKSRCLEANEPITLKNMIFVRSRSGGQILFIGVILSLLMVLWMRAAVIIYALFFGLHAFPGLADIAAMLFTTTTGLTMIIVGTLIGGLFAAFSFAISAFSIPMLLNEKTDAFTAMGTSMSLVWNNLPVMLCWGAIVCALFLVSLITGLVGLIVIFPLLAHATWHAYRAIQRPE